MDAATLKVNLKSEPHYLARIRRIAACVADSVGMNAQEVHDTELAITEACVNAIVHGSPGGDNDRVSIMLRCADRKLTAEVTDSGNGPDIGSLVDGLGIRLMRKVTDCVWFDKRAGRFTVCIEKNAGA
jgi:serine/threonine-protein kinase RsbW